MEANQEMIDGYMDGFDMSNPLPSSNRSESYRHGFANGRADKTGIPRGFSCDELGHMADTAMMLDEIR